MTLSSPTLVRAGDPMDGTWDIDTAASRYDPGPARTVDWRTYKTDGDTVHMVGGVTFEDGRSESIEYTGAYDGKDYPVKGNPRVHTIAHVKVDDRTVRTTTKRDGKVTSTSIRVISPDGRKMTISTKGTTDKGVAYDNTLVFHRRAAP